MCRLGPQTRLWIYLCKNPNFRKSRRKYCEEIILKTPRLESRLESSVRVNRMWLSAQTNSQQSGGFYLLLPLWRQQDLLWILCAISHNLPLSSSSGHDFHNKQFLDLNLCLDVLWSSGLQFPTGGGEEGRRGLSLLSPQQQENPGVSELHMQENVDCYPEYFLSTLLII